MLPVGGAQYNGRGCFSRPRADNNQYFGLWLKEHHLALHVLIICKLIMSDNSCCATSQ